jgi:hypothetical protein
LLLENNKIKQRFSNKMYQTQGLLLCYKVKHAPYANNTNKQGKACL